MAISIYLYILYIHVYIKVVNGDYRDQWRASHDDSSIHTNTSCDRKHVSIVEIIQWEVSRPLMISRICSQLITISFFFVITGKACVYLDSKNKERSTKRNYWGLSTCYPSGPLEFTPGFSGVCIIRSLVLCVCFVDRCLSFCPFSFGHCVVCPPSIYGFWLLFWYLQTLFTFSRQIIESFLHVASPLSQEFLYNSISREKDVDYEKF